MTTPDRETLEKWANDLHRVSQYMDERGQWSFERIVSGIVNDMRVLARTLATPGEQGKDEDGDSLRQLAGMIRKVELSNDESARLLVVYDGMANALYAIADRIDQLCSEKDKLEADNHRMRLGDMSVDDYYKLRDWMREPCRQPPSAAFTAGAARTAAIAFFDALPQLGVALNAENAKLTERVKELEGACAEFRDAALNQRHWFESPCLDSDQTNAVLSAYDDTIGNALLE